MSNANETSTRERLAALYPAFATMPSALLDEVMSSAAVQRVPKGAVLFDENAPCTAFPMILEGGVRVVKCGRSGRELQLYRVEPGESCILSTACMLGTTPYSARGEADSDVTMVVLPEKAFHRLVASHAPFRNYVFGLFSERITDLLALVEAVAFQRLDRRLARLLLGKGESVHATHQQLADELGSVREIVSRILKSFADRGLVALGREVVDVMDRDGLSRVAESD